MGVEDVPIHRDPLAKCNAGDFLRLVRSYVESRIKQAIGASDFVVIIEVSSGNV